MAETSPPSKEKTPSGSVELDLDDAPFLEDEDAESAKPDAPEEPATQEKPLEQPKPDAKPSLIAKLKAQKKKLALAGIAFIIIIAAAIGVNLFLGSGKEKIPPKPIPKMPEIETIVIPSKPPETPTNAPTFLIEWQPFLVEIVDSEGEVRLFYCKFSFPTNEQSVYIEMQNKGIVMRDSIFHYLRNLSYDFLIDQKNINELKAGIASVVNNDIRTGKLENVLIENYLIR